MRYLRWMLAIRRVEYFVAEWPIVLMAALLASGTARPSSAALGEATALFFLLFNLGDMANCLADRDLDARYKKHLSEAVYGLGVRSVAAQVIATGAAGLAVAAHLAWTTGRPAILALVVVGQVLGLAYSLPPVSLKARGLAGPACLWAILFVGPMLLTGAVLSPAPSAWLVLVAAAYGALQVGVLLINTAEDYPEDRAAGVRTAIVALGLRRGLSVAAGLAAVGAVCLGALELVLTLGAGAGPLLVWLAVQVAGALVLRQLFDLRHRASKLDLAGAIALVKARARHVPLWVTALAWSHLACIAAVTWAK